VEPGSPTTYRINTPKVVHDTVDEETLAIDSTSGAYYSIRGTGARIWGLLDRGCDVEAIVTALAGFHGLAPAVIEVDLRGFLADLQREGLIVPTATAVSPGPLSLRSAGEPPGWQPPAVEKFTDMERLLLIDPIHMVEDDGWPHEKKTPPKS
jgi:Coenzyme PQQ synthesis protein D (PqqD)